MRGIVLANTGSPPSPEPATVEAYLREYLMDERVRQLPKPLWRYLVYKHILPKRKIASAEKYRFIWTDEGSPLVVLQRRLAQKVQALYDAEPGNDVLVRSAMSYGSDSIAHVLAELRERGVEHVVLLPLYPQSAFSPTRAVVDAFGRAQDGLGWHPASTVIDNYHDHPAYIELMAEAMRATGCDPSQGDRLVLSFHAIPLKDERAGDTYRVQIAESVQLIAAKLGIPADSITVAYQSVFGHDASKWTGPLATDVLESWRTGGFRVVFACPGFAIDCLETLYDIPHRMVPALEGEGAAPVAAHADGDIQSACNTDGRFLWVPTPNASDAHAAMVKAVIDAALEKEPDV